MTASRILHTIDQQQGNPLPQQAPKRTVFRVQIGFHTRVGCVVASDNRERVVDIGRVEQLEEHLRTTQPHVANTKGPPPQKKNQVTGAPAPTKTSEGTTYCWRKPSAACLLFGDAPRALPTLYRFRKPSGAIPKGPAVTCATRPAGKRTVGDTTSTISAMSLGKLYASVRVTTWCEPFF
jgi:hypothetical protein